MIETYCWSARVYEIGAARIMPPRGVVQSLAPVSASKAKNSYPNPANTKSPPVESTPPISPRTSEPPAASSEFQRTSPVETSMARTPRVTGWLGGRSNPLAVNGLPLWKVGTSSSKKMSVASTDGTNRSFRWGSKEGDHQFVAPLAAGEIRVPDRLGWELGKGIGRPSAVNPEAHVCLAKGLAKRNRPVFRSRA